MNDFRLTAKQIAALKVLRRAKTRKETGTSRHLGVCKNLVVFFPCDFPVVGVESSG